MIDAAVRGVATGEPGRIGTAVASSALRDALAGETRPARLLGTSTRAWWCAIDDAVVVVADDRAVRLPNAVVVRPGPVESATLGETIAVGGGELRTTSGGWRIVRWWDPWVVPVDADPRAVADRVRGAVGYVPGVDEVPMTAPVRAQDDEGFLAAADRLLGRGAGLTPEGDDVLTGFVAGYRHAGASLGDTAAVSFVGRVREPLLSTARRSTTLLSWSLLRHAFAGEVAAPVGSLMRSLTGRGDVATAIAATRAIGHRSGPALVLGVVAGVAAACGVRP